jgi:hypothetical protein
MTATHVCLGFPCRECADRDPAMFTGLDVIEAQLSMHADVDDSTLCAQVYEAIADIPGVELDGVATVDELYGTDESRMVTVRVQGHRQQGDPSRPQRAPARLRQAR